MNVCEICNIYYPEDKTFCDRCGDILRIRKHDSKTITTNTITPSSFSQGY